MKLNAIGERKSLGEDVYDHLKQAIIDQDIEPGARLVENRIAQMLGISRTPLREALHKLEREDWIEKVSSGGFKVMTLSRQDIEETFGIRSVLEAYAARLAAENHRSSDLAPLEKAMKKFQESLEKKQTARLPEINTQFHDLLYAMSDSPRLIKMINQLRAPISRYRQIILKQAAYAAASCQDHADMLTAMRQRDADRVEDLVRIHILKGKQAVIHRIKEEDARKSA
ncbi:MAG TPA: GntR family transcriptional regulator [Desulfotignum sp.]|nr:GntR family transcriptional regulator [Desulfotignum sp.]